MIFFFLVVLLSDAKLTAQAFTQILNFNNFIDSKNVLPLITVAGTIFAYFSIIIISFGDFSRYIKDEQELKYGNLTLLINLIIFSFLQFLLLQDLMYF
jgi:NCS1 family nucleobase:cation symporter-1